MHLPQSLQTHEELYQLASVPTQIISPRECKPIISVVQDICLGLYRITKEHIRLTEKQVMMLMTTNPQLADVPMPMFENGKIKKWNGRQVLSTIFPKKINLEMKTYQYNENLSPEQNKPHIVSIKNGIIHSGTFDKDIYQARTRGIIHSIYNEYGPEETRNFFDNTQKLICNFLVLNGFSVGISDLVVDSKTKDTFKDIIRKMKVEVYDIIQKIHIGQYENKSTKSNADDFEKKVNDILNDAVKNVGNKGAQQIDETVNRLINMIKSKSKGNTINVSQMIGCLGQQNVDGRRIPYGFDDRTLPHYPKYDDGPESRGFVGNSFIQGLTPQEFFFHAMGGREGLIDTAVQTSETGYIQRKLVKAMEDCKVNYDYSVRNAAGSIIQFLYGDDGMDATKVESQTVPHIDMSMDKIIKEYQFSDDLQELKIMLDPKVFAEVQSKQSELKRRMQAHFDQLIDDRDFMIHKVFRGKAESSVMYPVSFQRTITIAKGVYHQAGMNLVLDITPTYILDTIDKLCNELFVNKHHRGNKLFQILVRAHLSPKQIITRHKLCKDAFDYVVEQVRFKFNESLAHPSEMVGVIAAQSLGEPATQLSTSKYEEVIVRFKDFTYKGPIGKLIDSILEDNPQKVVNLGHGSVVMDLEQDIEIIGVSNDEKTSWRRISQISRHPAKGDLVKVKTRSGRETTCTLSHSFLKRTVNGIEPVKGSDLKVGDRMPIARYIPNIPITQTTIQIGTKNYDLNFDLGWLCGVYIADGCINGTTVKISKIIPEFQDKIKEIGKRYFDVEMTQVARKGTGALHGYDMTSYTSVDNNLKHKDLAKFLEKFGNHCEKKLIPGWVYTAPIEFVKGLIGGYVDGDGNVASADGKGMIRMASVSEKLTTDFILLLSRVGIYASKCVETHIKEQGRKDLHTAQISRKYARQFRDEIGLVVKSKAEALEKVIKYVTRDDSDSSSEYIDKIPEMAPHLTTIGKCLELPGQSRLYKRFEKKESIGRNTLTKYYATFQKAYAEKQQEIEDRYADYKKKISDLESLVNQASNDKNILLDGHGATISYLGRGEKFHGLGRPQGSGAMSQWVNYQQIGRPTLEKFITHFKEQNENQYNAAKEMFTSQLDPAMAAVKSALEADVIWDEITELEIIKDDGELVYDFTVPGNDSFMVGCGVLVHNTLNSVHYDTKMLLKVDGDLKVVTMGEFVDNYMENIKKEYIEAHSNDTWLGWVKDHHVEVQSCDKDGRIKWTKVEAVTKHPVINADGTNTLLKVTLKSGRSVIATKAKSFLQRKNNEIVQVDGKDLKIGQFVPVSRTCEGQEPYASVIAQIPNEEKWYFMDSYVEDNANSACDTIPEIILSSGKILTRLARNEARSIQPETEQDSRVINNIRQENIMYDEIVSIEEISNDHPYVYDFTVEETRNFNILNGICMADTFHLSGVSAASKTVRGVPRLKELLSVSKNIKTPSMKIYFKDEFKTDMKKCLELMNDIRTVRFKDIVKSSKIYFDPNDNLDEDKRFVKMYKEFLALDQCNNNLSPWVLRLEFHKEKMLQYHIDMIQIHQKLLDYYKEENISCMFSDDNADQLIFRIKLFINDSEADDMLTELKALEYNIMENIIIKGTENVERVSLVKEDKKLYNPITKEQESQDEWIVYTDGTNFREIIANDSVNGYKTVTNNVNEIYEVLGIEAARQALFNEINEVLDLIYVNYRHIALLVDMQTNKGTILSIDRHGINRGDIGPLAKCSFEETTDKLIKAGIFAEHDKINGVSANIMLGQIAPAGTGDAEILIDEGKLAELEFSNEDERPRYMDDELAENLCGEDVLGIDFELPAVVEAGVEQSKVEHDIIIDNTMPPSKKSAQAKTTVASSESSDDESSSGDEKPKNKKKPVAAPKKRAQAPKAKPAAQEDAPKKRGGPRAKKSSD